MILKSLHLICEGMVGHIGDYEYIIASYRVEQCTFAFTAAESGQIYACYVIIFDISLKSRIGFEFIVEILSEFDQIPVDTAPELLGTGRYDEFDGCNSHQLL